MTCSSLLRRQFHQCGFRGVVHQVEHVFRIQLVFVQRRLFAAVHPHRCRVDDDVKLLLGDVGALQVFRFRLTCQRLRLLGRSVRQEYLRAFCLQSERCCACRTASADDQDASSREIQPLLERHHDSRDIGIEAVQLTAGATYYGVTGADLLGQRIGVLQGLRISCLYGMVTLRPRMGIS